MDQERRNRRLVKVVAIIAIMFFFLLMYAISKPVFAADATVWDMDKGEIKYYIKGNQVLDSDFNTKLYIIDKNTLIDDKFEKTYIIRPEDPNEIPRTEGLDLQKRY